MEFGIKIQILPLLVPEITLFQLATCCWLLQKIQMGYQHVPSFISLITPSVSIIDISLLVEHRGRGSGLLKQPDLYIFIPVQTEVKYFMGQLSVFWSKAVTP